MHALPGRRLLLASPLSLTTTETQAGFGGGKEKLVNARIGGGALNPRQSSPQARKHTENAVHFGWLARLQTRKLRQIH